MPPGGITPSGPCSQQSTRRPGSGACSIGFFTGQTSPAEDQWRFRKWRNEITRRSLELYSEYEPGSFVERIAPTPLLKPQDLSNDGIVIRAIILAVIGVGLTAAAYRSWLNRDAA